jgi:glycosyltransferase involved in cell wall biosynthesis
MSLSLGGFVCCRNVISLDYCVSEAIQSLLPVCSEVIVCDSDSSDGTTELLHQMARQDSRIRVINWPWTDPQARSHHAWVEWLNFARQHLTTDCQITLDADEVLDDAPECHRVILDALGTDQPARFFHRLNFWRDPHSLIPPGVCLADRVARMGFADRTMHSDEPRTEDGADWRILDEATFHPDLKIFHLGFLRRKSAFYAKNKAVARIWNGEGRDPRLVEGEAKGLEVWETDCAWTNDLLSYPGPWPQSVKAWLEKRGHRC